MILRFLFVLIGSLLVTLEHTHLVDVNAPAEPCECVRLRLQLTERQPRALGVEYFMDSLERLRRRRRLLTSRIAFCAAASTAAGKRGANACADRVPLARRGDAVIWQRVSFVSMRIGRIPRRDNPPRRDLPRRRDLAAAHEQAEPQQRNRRFLCVWEVSGQPVGLWVGGESVWGGMDVVGWGEGGGVKGLG